MSQSLYERLGGTEGIKQIANEQYRPAGAGRSAVCFL